MRTTNKHSKQLTTHDPEYVGLGKGLRYLVYSMNPKSRLGHRWAFRGSHVSRVDAVMQRANIIAQNKNNRVSIIYTDESDEVWSDILNAVVEVNGHSPMSH